MQGHVAVNVWVKVEGGVCWGSFAIGEELVSDSGWRDCMESAGGQTRRRVQGRGAGVLVAHVTLTGML